MSVYLDHAATTAMRPSARAAMEPYLGELFANPSGSHRLAREARRAVDDARDRIARCVGAKPGEIVFTSGGTEADNAAVLGAVRAHGGVAVCPAAEHHAVLHCVEHVGGTIVGVGTAGAVEPAALADALDELSSSGGRVSVVSAMAVNNEVGSVTDLAAVAAVVRRRAPGALLHTDAVQAACWLPLDQIWPHVDLLALSAHKFGGPKGVGILVVRDGVHIEPLVFGGGQERDRRSGTHHVAGIVGAAVALDETTSERVTTNERIGRLRARLFEGISQRVDGVHDTIGPDAGVPGILHLCIEGVESEALLFVLDRAGVCASAASACAAGAAEPSHVLAAMGVPRTLADGALRLSFGHATDTAEVDRAVEVVAEAIVRLRAVARGAS
jgi:cysteine desulfurase